VDWMQVVCVFGYVVGIAMLVMAAVLFVVMVCTDETYLVVPVGGLLLIGGFLIAIGAGAQA
jgi:hypothetical protein